MFHEGYGNIVNIDVSHNCIELMDDKYRQKIPELKCNQHPYFKTLNNKY